jgi:hypothetical protein
MIDAASMEEYLMTFGILLSFIALLASVVLGRRQLRAALKGYGITRRHVAYALLISLMFLVLELGLVHPTQQLFFDDTIYQAQALGLIHGGQAWLCDSGTPTNCIVGEVFHEPIGTAFNLAIGFTIFGVSRGVSYGVMLLLSFIAVFLTYIIAYMLARDTRVAVLSSSLLALSPILLVWAMPTTSDIPTLTYTVLSLFFMMIFLKRKSAYTLAMLAFSAVLLSYMKVNDILFFAVLVIGYLLLDDKSVIKSVKKNVAMVKNSFAGRAFVVFLLFMVALTPMMIYAYNESAQGNYGYMGSNMQNTCSASQSMMAKGNFNVQNFEYNICSNVLFWFNTYSSTQIMQPTFFTLLALLGAMFLWFNKRRPLAFLAVWFLAFFLLYTAFYAGSVTYGVDWRFMLSVIAPFCILGGFGGVAIIEIAESVYQRFSSKRAYRKNIKLVHIFAYLVIIAGALYSIISLAPILGIQPSQIQQAGDARFYESFVYNQSGSIPNSCVVLTYVPSLFNLVNKSAAQMYMIYNSTAISRMQEQYSCIVIDWGYWCYTPNNYCANIRTVATLVPIVNATNPQTGETFGFYYLRNYTN